MLPRILILLMLLMMNSTITLRAENVLTNWKDDVQETGWETGATFATMTALGLSSWDWGSSKSFRWNPEGWFGEDTGSGGADKLGHAFTSYTITGILADRLIRKGRSPERASLSAALTTQAIMFYVEFFDAYSNDHGFSWEDCVMNLSGTGFAVARTIIPGLHDLVDYRMEYYPSGYNGFRPFSDYSGQKYLLALKLSGIDALSSTPLRFVELQGGYYTRGYSKKEAAVGLEASRHAYVGIGLNLGELLLGHRERREPELKNAGRMFFEYIQLPHTSLQSSKKL